MPCFTTFPNTSKISENTRPSVVFPPLFSASGNVVERGFLFLGELALKSRIVQTWYASSFLHPASMFLPVREEGENATSNLCTTAICSTLFPKTKIFSWIWSTRRNSKSARNAGTKSERRTNEGITHANTHARKHARKHAHTPARTRESQIFGLNLNTKTRFLCGLALAQHYKSTRKNLFSHTSTSCCSFSSGKRLWKGGRINLLFSNANEQFCELRLLKHCLFISWPVFLIVPDFAV